ncbi:MAG TPA: DUF2461 domain-containing protein [Candidatus Limnocylindrales bacterium]|jgi:uncharacterized protein (TIGR02453 family)
MATAAGFPGFKREAIQFLADLAANNERAWFQPRKADYERLLKEPMEQLCVALAERFAERGIPLDADPKRSPFRIYRDTRFSKDKSPYKTHVAASFPWVDRPGTPTAEVDAGAHANGGYLNFQPGEMYLGGGMWMPHRERLEAFRRAVRDEPDRVRAALEEPGFVAWFGGAHSHEQLKRVPPGYPPDHPLADMLRWKDVIFGRRLSDREVLSKDLPDLIADGYAAAMPVFRFLATVRPAPAAG